VSGPKKTLFCVPTDELLQAKDDLLSEGGQSLSSLTEQVVKRILNLLLQSSTRMQNLGLGLHQNAFGGRAPPGPAEGAKVLPRPPSRNKGGLLLRQGGGRGVKGKGGEGKGRGGVEEGKEGKDDLHPTLFLGPV